MPERPTLYLDFDGVLHPDAVYRTREGKIVLRRDGIALFEWLPIFEALIAPYGDLQIVLSTSWVRELGYDETVKRLSQAVRKRVVGATWHRHQEFGWWDSVSRFRQICADATRNKHLRWVAIDNDGDDWPEEHRERLILTDDDLGLGQATVQRELKEKVKNLVNGMSALK